MFRLNGRMNVRLDLRHEELRDVAHVRELYSEECVLLCVASHDQGLSVQATVGNQELFAGSNLEVLEFAQENFLVDRLSTVVKRIGQTDIVAHFGRLPGDDDQGLGRLFVAKN